MAGALLPVRTQRLFQQFELFENAIVVEEREQGLTRLRQLSLEGEEVRRVQFAEPACVTWLGYNLTRPPRACAMVTAH